MTAKVGVKKLKGSLAGIEASLECTGINPVAGASRQPGNFGYFDLVLAGCF